MYRDRFGTDWQSLGFEEAIRRMYTLGVASEVGSGLPEERERILATADAAYTERLLELAYEEGQESVREARDGRRDADSVEELLRDGPSVLDDAEEDGSFADPPDGVPDAVSVPPMLEEETDELERVRLPELLRRGGE